MMILKSATKMMFWSVKPYLTQGGSHLPRVKHSVKSLKSPLPFTPVSKPSGNHKQLEPKHPPSHLCLNCFLQAYWNVRYVSLWHTPHPKTRERHKPGQAGEALSPVRERPRCLFPTSPPPSSTSAGAHSLSGWSQTGKIPMCGTRTEEVGGWFRTAGLSDYWRSQLLRYQLN